MFIIAIFFLFAIYILCIYYFEFCVFSGVKYLFLCVFALMSTLFFLEVSCGVVDNNNCSFFMDGEAGPLFIVVNMPIIFCILLFIVSVVFLVVFVFSCFYINIYGEHIITLFVFIGALIVLYIWHEIYLANMVEFNVLGVYRAGGFFNTTVYTGTFIQRSYKLSPCEAERLFDAVMSDRKLHFYHLREYMQLWPISRSDIRAELVRLLVDNKIGEARRYVSDVDLSIRRSLEGFSSCYLMGCFTFAGVVFLKILKSVILGV